jgi:hypothetical protein
VLILIILYKPFVTLLPDILMGKTLREILTGERLFPGASIDRAVTAKLESIGRKR